MKISLVLLIIVGCLFAVAHADVYIIQLGDTLEEIARKLGVGRDEIMDLNETNE